MDANINQFFQELETKGEQARQSAIGVAKMLSKTSHVEAADVTTTPSSNQNEIVSALIRIAQGIESLDKTLDVLADAIYRK